MNGFGHFSMRPKYWATHFAQLTLSQIIYATCFPLHVLYVALFIRTKSLFHFQKNRVLVLMLISDSPFQRHTAHRTHIWLQRKLPDDRSIAIHSICNGPRAIILKTLPVSAFWLFNWQTEEHILYALANRHGMFYELF